MAYHNQVKQSPQKLSPIKLFKINFCNEDISIMASLSNSRWQNRRERPNRTTNNGDMAKPAKRPVSNEASLLHLYIIVLCF